MDNPTNLPSLLPYLHSDGAGFHLKLSRSGERGDRLDSQRVPFTRLGSCGPFGRLLAGALVSDAGSHVRPVVLLQQADVYAVPPDDLWPIHNPEVDRVWHQAFDRAAANRKSNDPSPAPIVLAGQTGDTGGVRPFAPLFYCVPDDRFFHPFCPQCGFSLQLCSDDDLLSASGLATYSGSLQRFLYCPQCRRNAEICEFYALKRQPDDPEMVVDFTGLVERYRRTSTRNPADTAFPCPACEERHECDGNSGRLVDRIVPFSFYPFHLLLFEGRFRKSRRFMNLLGGKPDETGDFEGIRPDADGMYSSEATSPYLFPAGSRGRLLEVLYLKLTFLADLTQVLPPESSRFYRFPFSLDHVWVRMPAQGGLLPFFWNFQTRVFDLGLTGEGDAKPERLPPAYGCYFLGDLWFVALLANAEQDENTVRGALRQCRSEMAEGVPLSQVIRDRECRKVFDPGNLLWHPEEAAPGSLGGLWQRSLDLGARLWTAGTPAADTDTRLPEGFYSEFQALRSALRAEMFERRPPQAPASISTDDAEIRAVLESIARQWRRKSFTNAAEPVKAPVADPPPEAEAQSGTPSAGDDDMPRTVILRRQAADPPRRTTEEKIQEDGTPIFKPEDSHPPPEETADEDVFQRTVILRTMDLQDAEFEEVESRTDRAEPDTVLPETVIISPGMAKRSSGAGQPQSNSETDGPGRTGAGEGTDAPEDGDDDLLKTVILKPKNKSKR